VHEVFSRPANLAVASAVAVETVQAGRVVDCSNGLVTVMTGQARLVALSSPLPNGSEVYVCIRAEDVILLKAEAFQSSSRNSLKAIVSNLSTEGPIVRIDLEAGFPLTALLTRQACEDLTLKKGDRVLALVKAPQVHLIPR
ncbi:MAG TPA: TOBE domain-containing protein, partial [Patescibacteria group bacterium]|nr:TOBE domain-containing protein [Patescibacteria group bacterium]